VIAQGRILLEGGRENQIAAGNAGQDAAQLNENVRRGPKGVAADALVPGNVPRAANYATDHRDKAGPYVPGDRFRARNSLDGRPSLYMRR